MPQHNWQTVKTGPTNAVSTPSTETQAEVPGEEAAMVAEVDEAAGDVILEAEDGKIISTVSTLPTHTEVSPVLNGTLWDPMVVPQ